jgi:uncharacterized membrane protein YcgQ (UPF0703/DUF1980 family)
MRTVILACCVLLSYVSMLVSAEAQQNTSNDQTTVEGTVVSTTRDTLLLQTDSNVRCARCHSNSRSLRK